MRVNIETVIYSGNREIKIYIQNGFYGFEKNISVPHRHLYPELHVVSGGRQCFLVGNERIFLGDGQLLLIPKDTLHACIESGDNTLHTTFQLDGIECNDEIKQADFNGNSLLEIFNEITASRQGRISERLKAYLSLLCAEILSDSSEAAKPICDRGFLIHEFFSLNYHREIYISDLAAELHLGEKQTERAVLQYTGRSFRQELIARRIEAAKILMENSDFTLSEIGAHVGYQTYSGFWKAIKKYK